MNVSTNYSTTNQAYKHLSEAERGKIEAYLCSGIKPAEIARRLRRTFYSDLDRMTNTLCYHKETRREEDRVCQSSRIRVYEALPD